MTTTRMLAVAGFEDVEVQVTRVHDSSALAESSGCCSVPDSVIQLEPARGRLVSAFVRARKPPLE